MFARSYPGMQMAAAVPSKRLGYVKEIRSEYVGFLCAAAPMLPPGHRVFVLHDEDGFPACRLQDPRGGNSGRSQGADGNRNIALTGRSPRIPLASGLVKKPPNFNAEDSPLTPPRLSMNADITGRQPRAKTGCEHSSKLRSYSIASSARASKVGGISGPSAFAVFG